ncbi:hypothetical protein FACS1894140_6570 [Spirochaetia bacterium]|nr:hypothetical protein FACS1894140_6570 [Spirochaetia bacterium]
MKSQEELFDEIRKSNIIDYGEKFEKWAPQIIVHQYSDRTHFIYELLQNAEDAKATHIWFHLFHDRLELLHDGKKQIEESHVKGLCGVGDGTKGEGDIGKFGIGFKSVFAYTTTPKVISSNYQFEIRNIIMPYVIEKTEYSQIGNNTLFILPFDRSDIPSDVAFKEISEALLNDLMGDALLFLDNIFEVYLEIEGGGKYLPTIRSTKIICEFVNEVSITDGDEETKQKYYIFIQPVQYGNKIFENKFIKIAYKKENEKATIIPCGYDKVFVSFSTSQESHLNFAVHAPFNTTPARDNIVSCREDKYNATLAQILSKLFEKSIVCFLAFKW